MNYTLILTYILTIVLFLGTPGPVTVMVANNSSRYGFLAGFATIAGTNAASLVLIGISFAVIQGLFTVSETALLYLTLFGSLYLVYFAVGIIKDKIDIQSINMSSTKTLSKNHFKDGFVVGISNPKDILFFIAFFPMFFGVADNSFLAMFILVMVWVLLDYVILSCYSLIFSKIVNNAVVNVIGKLSGSILLCVAVYMIYKTLIGLFG
ncbi:MAG: LysE family translocator [Moraxella sp.]|nr:LysE family translocator [Moraxella sp.]